MSQNRAIAVGADACFLLPNMANRHGLIAGATGTGKTVTLRSMAENFSRIGVPVFVADVKGDLSGTAFPGLENEKINQRAQKLGLTDFSYKAFPVTFWDIYGQNGHPVRTTISELGPLLLTRLLNLNDTQGGVLNLIFKIADDQGLLLLDLKDLRAMLQYAGDHAGEYKTSYGNISAASIGAIQRGLLELESQGADRLFGEPALNLDDLMQTDNLGQGMINILSSEKLINSPKLYTTFLLWLMSELFEQLPEAGDLPKPKLAFFFDEAHLLFNEMPSALQEKIEQVVRLIRSKGVGIYFVSQSPLDIPDVILGQLGHRVQHALRAFTPRDQKAVKAAAETFRINPALNVETEITGLGVGEALVSFLDENGRPGMVEKALIIPPESRLGILNPGERQSVIQKSVIFGVYEKSIDRESAYEILKQRSDQAATAENRPAQMEQMEKAERRSAGMNQNSGSEVFEALAKSAARAVGSSLGRQLIRGVLGSLMGGGRRR